jgi:photosystem II stability/assembly factor-like uncharacterized protein
MTQRLFLLLLAGLMVWTLPAQEIDMSLFKDMTPRNIGPAGMSGRVTSIAVVERDMDKIYIGTAAGGVWMSDNAGHTWTPIFDDAKAASIGDIAIYQRNPNIMYVGTGEGNPRNSQNSGRGMFKSIDGGKTWTHLGLDDTRQIHRVIVHPDNPDHVVIGVSGATWGDSEERGVYRTTDGGKTWNRTLYTDERTGIADLVADPNNPNKLVAAMYEHRRYPWFYESGGSGSGIYLSHDGGATWTETTKGLPEGDLGRIGLAFATNVSDLIYAYVESKSNAVYASTDGGYTWERRSRPGDGGIGGRPFYYADIYVDPNNENRIYSIASTVTISEDGGRNWSSFAPGNKIHTDHHAYWINPTDSEHIMVGHDGGLNITHDRGKKWWFADNLPLGQFYHMRVDMDVPYNVYGGLQDNGSWIGPSVARFSGGIRNLYWQRVSVGDGFDVVPDPKNMDYGYSMGQAGSLYRYHRPSGQLNLIKPTHPDGEYLRFNWNAGIAIDPFDEQTIYYGSQYVHKTSDFGGSWEIISPDLTTDDPDKQEFLESGGLTYDVTGAENHTTIISIAPSTTEEGVIWVGTDDGNVQLTRNSGESWTNLIDNIKGVPANTWVTHISPSLHRDGEAFVVFDDHRRNNWEPYVYRTRDYGRTWDRIVAPGDVDGYTWTFAQSPTAENLCFVGAEFGLYVSFDAGQTWNKWTEGYPESTPTSDLTVHPREHDLVIATFGRSFWILDDIRPLEEMAEMGANDLLAKAMHVFPVGDAYMWNMGESIGYRAGKIGDALYNGENREYGALINVYLGEDTPQPEGRAALDDQVLIEILNEQGEVVRHLYQTPAPGLHRIAWDLERDGVRSPQQPKPSTERPPRGGSLVLPGTYTARVSYQGQIMEHYFEVIADPYMPFDMASAKKTDQLIAEMNEVTTRATAVMDAVREHQEVLGILKKQADADKHQEVHEQIKTVSKELTDLQHSMLGERKQGIYRDPTAVTAKLGQAAYQLRSPQVASGANKAMLVKQARDAVSVAEANLKSIETGSWQVLKKQIDKAGLSLL